MKQILAVALIVVASLFILSTPTVLAEGPCTADFNCDQNVDGGDVGVFLTQFGRSLYNDPCPDCYDSACPCTASTTTTTAISLVPDATDDNIGPVDLIGAQAELYDRGDQTLLRLTIESTSLLPGLVIFECDVDNDTSTGGTVSIIGQSFVPCPCKITPGMDIAIFIPTRRQGDSSSLAFCKGCSDGFGPCAGRRQAGEWFAITTAGDFSRNLGVLRGLLDPLPQSPTSGNTQDSYTVPWSQILEYAHEYLSEIADPSIFDWNAAINPANNKWQVSVWHDPVYADEDDFISGLFIYDVNDWLPNGDGNKADMQILTGSHDLCY